MSVRIKKRYVVFDSITGYVFEPEYARIAKDVIEKYLEYHPMPEDPKYTKEDLINDLTNMTGNLLLPEDLKDETVDFLEDLLGELWYKNWAYSNEK